MTPPTKDELEAQLHYPLGSTMPEPGKILQVAPGVKWIRMALPFALDHINLWLLRDNIDGTEGWTVVDCCIDHAESRAQWNQIFEHALEGLPVLRVIATHMHPDHIGLAHWLCERWGCRLWISATDYNAARIGIESTTGFGGAPAAAFFASHGMTDPESLEQIKQRSNYFRNLVPALPRQFRRMMEGQTVSIGTHAWRCISGFGHAPEHIALFSESLGVLISGDMVLPRISTNVSVYDQEPEANSLKLFLDSIAKYLALPNTTLVLPSHGKPFTGLHERIHQLNDHHRDRLSEVVQACSEKPSSAMDIIPMMFTRALDLHQTTFAMGEAVAHLHLLWYNGQLKRSVDSSGVHRFSTTSNA